MKRCCETVAVWVGRCRLLLDGWYGRSHGSAAVFMSGVVVVVSAGHWLL